jgi:hypothetical protein
VGKVLGKTKVQYDVAGERFYTVNEGILTKEIAEGDIDGPQYEIKTDVATMEGLLGLMEGDKSDIVKHAKENMKYVVDNYKTGKITIDTHGFGRGSTLKLAMSTASKVL